MRAGTLWALCLAIVSAGRNGAAEPSGDGGGRDVSVALFSTRVLHGVTVTPVGAHAWVARCARCVHESLTVPLHVSSATEIFAGGLLRLKDDADGEARVAAGLWHLRGRAHGHEVEAVLTLPSEHYVAAVLNAEASPDEPAESLRALAILARTYALNGRHHTAAPGRLQADLCDSTACQAMRLGAVSPAIEEATRATAGETLWFGARRAEVFFSQNCGGETEDAGAVWPALRGLPYLRHHADPFCLRRESSAWHAEVTMREFAAIARAEGWRVPATISTVQVAERDASGRAVRIRFADSGGASGAVSAGALRFGVGRALGWNRVRSDAYEVALHNGVLIFDGRGHGHGVGLCQAGAAEMATEGGKAREILRFYFPGTQVRILHDDDGWQRVQVGPLTVRDAAALTWPQRDELEAMWKEVQRRFPPREVVRPEIVFAPSTEIFRQLTTEPGWALASTRGSTVVLQPAPVLRAHGGGLQATFLHEMLHVLVEAEAGERTPLWLREGLVEALAGASARTGRGEMLSGATIDAELLQATTLAASARAHRSAAARVRHMLDRYGFAAVRGWLTSGVPPGIA